MFRRIVFSAGLAGIVAGILSTASRQLQVAPSPEARPALAPPELARTFIGATAVTNAVFRMVPGAGGTIACGKLA